MNNMRRPANITVRGEWYWLLILIGFGGYLLVIGVHLMFESDFFESSVCLLFGSIGIFGFLNFKLITTKVYVAEQVIEWRERSLLGGTDFKIVPFSTVHRVDIQTISGMSRGNKTSQRLALKCEEFTLPLSSGYSGNRAGLESLRNKFLDALTMEAPIDDFSAELEQLIESNNKIVAIKYIREKKGVSLVEAKKFLKDETEKYHSKE